MGHFTAFQPAHAGLRQPSVQQIGTPSAQNDAAVSLIPFCAKSAQTEEKA